MKEKAGILTFHCVPNYGAVLQAYGMQQALEKYFDHVEMIDYRPKAVMAEYHVINFYSIFSTAMSIWSAIPFLQKKHKFSRFAKNRMHLSAAYPQSSPLQGMDMVVLGSDQIWNSEITRGLDPAYFGNLVWKDRPYVISYAASLGKAKLNDQECTQFKTLLTGIDAISVRESEAKDLLQSLTEKEISVVIDPTLLAGVDCFASLVKPVPYSRYLLIYSLTGYKETQDLAVKVAKYLGLRIVEISGRRKGLISKGHTTIYTAGPEDFLSLIASADFVVTDSFHGTVFSLLFHRQFLTVPHKTRGGRMQNLLSLCNLTERMTASFKKELVLDPVDWNSVDHQLELARKESETFLRKAVEHCDETIR